MPPPPSQSVSTTLQPARWDSKGLALKGKARDYSSSDSGSEDRDDVLRPSFGMSSSNHRRHEGSSRSDSRASSSKSATSREYEGDFGLLNRKDITDHSKQELRHRRTEEKSSEFRMIKQASPSEPRANSLVSSGSEESEEVPRGGAQTGHTRNDKQKDLQPIPSPPWAKSKTLPVQRDEPHTAEKRHDVAKNQYPTAASSSRGSAHHYTNASSSTSTPALPTSLYTSQYDGSHLDSRRSSRGEEAGPSSEARYAWAAPQVARPQPDTTLKPTLFKWVHSNPLPAPPFQPPRLHSIDQLTHPGGANIPHRGREADQQCENEVGSTQGGRRSDHHHSERDTQWAKQVIGSDPAHPPHSASRPISGTEPVPQSRSSSIGRGYPHSPRSYGVPPPSPYADLPGQHYGGYGMRYQHPPPPPTMPSPRSNGYPYYRSQSYTYPPPHASHPPRPPTPTRHRSYDHSSMSGPPPPLSPRAGQKRRFESGDEDRGSGRQKTGTTGEDVDMDRRGRESSGGPPASTFTSQDVEMSDQTTRSNSSSSHRTGHPRPGPGRLHWMPPEVAPSGSTASSNPDASSGHPPQSFAPPASQRGMPLQHYPITSNSLPSLSYHSPYPPPPPPGYRAGYPPPPSHGYSQGPPGPPPHHELSSRDVRPYPPSYPPPTTSQYGHPGYPPPPPHSYGAGIPPPPSGPGVPPAHHYHYMSERERIYEAEWRGRPSHQYEGHRSSSYSSRPRSNSNVGSDRPPPASYYSYPNSRPRVYAPGGPPPHPPPPQPYPPHRSPPFHQHPPQHRSHSPPPPPPPPIPPPPPPHLYPPHLDPPPNAPPTPHRTYEHEPYPHPYQDARRRYQVIMKQRFETSSADVETKPSPGSPMDTQQDPLPTSPQATSLETHVRAGGSSNGYVPPSEAESGGMVSPPAPLAIEGGKRSPFEGGEGQSAALSGGGEYEQHPLRQQTSYLPMNAVGGAQFVLKPPRQPKPRSLKPRTNGSGSGDGNKSDKPKEPVLKFKEMTGKEREGKRPRRRMKNRMANEHMLMSGGNIFVPHVMDMHSGMGSSQPITYVRMNPPPHPPAVAAHMAATIPAWDSNQPFVDLRDTSRPPDDDESTTSPSEASEASPPPQAPSPPPVVMLSPRWTNEAGNSVGQEPVLHRSPSPIRSSGQSPRHSPRPRSKQGSPSSPRHSPRPNSHQIPFRNPPQNPRQSPPRSPQQSLPQVVGQDLIREASRSPPIATQTGHFNKLPPGFDFNSFMMSSPSPSPPRWRPPFRRLTSLSDDDLCLELPELDDPRKEFMIGATEDAEPDVQDSGDPVGSETNTFAAPARPSATIKKYPCDVCDQIFTRSGDVKRHKISRHGEGSTGCICPFCDRVLTRQDALQRHWDWYCRKASRRNIHRYRLRMGLTDDEYEDAIDSRPVFLGPAPNSLSREEQEDEAALGGSSGIDVKPYRTIVPANGSRPSHYGRHARKNKKGKRRGKVEPKKANGVVKPTDDGGEDEDELESEDPLDYVSDNAKEEREARKMALGVDDDDDEDIDQLDDSEDETRRKSGVKSDAEGESIHGDDDSASESEASEQEDGSFGYRHTEKMGVEPARAPIRMVTQPSALPATRPASSQPAPPTKDMPRSPPSIPYRHEQQTAPNRPLLAMGHSLSGTGPQMVHDTNYRSSPAPPQPTDPHTNPFRPLSNEPSPQPLIRLKSRSASVSTTGSNQPTYTSSITFQHVTTFTRKPRPKRPSFDVDLDPSQTAAQGGQIRMRVLPQTTDMAPIQPALAIMHEHPHFDKKKGKRNDGQVPEYGFVPREYVYREKE